jgi:hypothetical protein
MSTIAGGKATINSGKITNDRNSERAGYCEGVGENDEEGGTACVDVGVGM